MNEYILFETVRIGMERMWREAERQARLLAIQGHYAPEAEAERSREAGGRA